MKKKKALLAVMDIFESFTKHEANIHAAQASFYIVIAAVPFVMALLTILQLIPGLSWEDVTAVLDQVIPANLQDFVNENIYDLSVKSPKTMLFVTVVVTLWSSSTGILAIETGLNKINGCISPKNYLIRRVKSMGYTLAFILMVISSLVAVVLGKRLKSLIMTLFPALNVEVLADVFNWARIVTIGLIFVCILFFYAYLPFKKQKLVKQIPGAVFSVVAWGLFSFGFSLYFSLSTGFSYMYGSMTTIALFMLWVFFSISIIFVGAEINNKFK